jgi:hypothetical protein
MAERDFYLGYKERLDAKLRHKNQQIARTERLLQTLSADQRLTFEALLAEEREHRDDIQAEMDQLYRLLAETGNDKK